MFTLPRPSCQIRGKAPNQSACILLIHKYNNLPYHLLFLQPPWIFYSKVNDKDRSLIGASEIPGLQLSRIPGTTRESGSIQCLLDASHRAPLNSPGRGSRDDGVELYGCAHLAYQTVLSDRCMETNGRFPLPSKQKNIWGGARSCDLVLNFDALCTRPHHAWKRLYSLSSSQNSNVCERRSSRYIDQMADGLIYEKHVIHRDITATCGT